MHDWAAEQQKPAVFKSSARLTYHRNRRAMRWHAPHKPPARCASEYLHAPRQDARSEVLLQAPRPGASALTPRPAKTTARSTRMAVQFSAGSMLRAHAPAPWLWAPPPLRRALPCPPPQRTACSRHQRGAKNVPGACWRRALAGENAWRVVSHAPRALRWRLRFGAMQATRAESEKKEKNTRVE